MTNVQPKLPFEVEVGVQTVVDPHETVTVDAEENPEPERVTEVPTGPEASLTSSAGTTSNWTLAVSLAWSVPTNE